MEIKKLRKEFFMTIQFINDESGNPQYVVIEYENYMRMTSDLAKNTDEQDEDEMVDYGSDEYYY